MFQKEYDVAVAGGGVAGIAAAIAAARRGLKTVLVEKTVLTGGLATAGIVNVYLPLCDGNGTQVSFGLTEEMLHRSYAYGPGDFPPDWKQQKNAPELKRFQTAFSPASFTLALDEMLEEAGVEVWLDTVVTGAVVENNRLAKIRVYNKSGEGFIAASCFVDGTGDSDLAVQSGCEYLSAMNSQAIWALEYRKGGKGRGCAQDISVKVIADALNKPNIPAGINGRIVSESVLTGRRQYRESLKNEYASGKYDRNSLHPLKFPAMPDLRHTRCFDARFVLRDGMEWTRFEDSVGLAADWRKSGLVWEIPYRSLLPKTVTGLVAAGRCTGACGDAWEVTRVIPVAALTGEAAGVAAALAVAAGTTPDQLDARVVQKELASKCGFPLHFKDLGISK